MQTPSIRIVGRSLLVPMILLLTTALAEARPVTWHNDIHEAAREATRTKKPLLVKFTASWCGYCQKMTSTFSDEKIAAQLADCFIAVEIDVDRNQEFASTVGVDALPTTLIATPELKVLKRITGFQTPSELDDHLDGMCHAKQKLAAGKGVEAQNASATTPAFDGLSLVTLIEKHELQLGNARITIKHRGQTICFVSQEERALFRQNPDRYWPALDGQCPVSSADAESQAGDPAIAALFRGKLWFFASEAHYARFTQDPITYARSVRR